MKTQNPVNILGVPKQLLQWAQTLHLTLNGGITHGTPTSKDSTGNYNKFEKDNMDGVLIRIGASGTVDNENAWTTTGVGIAVNHGLLRQPVGCHLVSSDKALSIWQPVLADINTITLAPSDATAYATVYVF